MNLKSILAGAALALAAQGGWAIGFEGGIPSDWTCDGLCGTLGADGDVTLAPTGAQKYGYVVSGQSTPQNLSPFTFGSETTGSRLLSSSFVAAAGDELKFHFNYVTSDGSGYADYGWARLLNASDMSQAALLFTARTKPTGSIVPGQDMPLPQATLNPVSVGIITNAAPGVGPTWSPLGTDSTLCYEAGCGYTGWVQSNFTIAASGKYVLEFGVVNWSDNIYQSGMAFDGITVAGEDVIPSVPETQSYAMLLAGLGVLGMALRRRRNA
ncbi:MAG: NF038132 family protein [Burkholderiales bacterium]|nr:NF038132 family protein [Burkholderiales bacterium]